MIKGVVWSMFDGSGYAVKDWAENGFLCYCFNFDDADHGDYKGVKVKHENIIYVNKFIDVNFLPWAYSKGIKRPSIIFGFPPCTDLANCGSRSWERKRKENPNFQKEAAETAKLTYYFSTLLKVPYFVENPVGVLSTMWRKPDFIFDPFEYGGYLDDFDKHPHFPQYIKSRDSYPKKTCLWTGGGFVIPPLAPVSVLSGYSAQYKKLGGKSTKTKMIRSLTPRGFARAVYLHNYKGVQNENFNEVPC